jgi:fucose 4-O-acetylase-like acetyltransferase
MNNSLVNERTRNHTMDFLKGICIICVVFVHGTGWSRDEELRYLYPFWIDFAVPIFMAISGYVHSKSFIRHGVNSISEAYTYKNISSKVIRYTVPFMVAYVIEILYFALYKGNSYGIKYIVRCFIDGGVGPGSYYYPVMMQFVFSFPVIFFMIRRYDFKGLIGCLIANAVYEVLQNAYGVSEDTYRLLML